MNYDDIRRVYSIRVCMGMDEGSMAHVHLAKDDISGSHQWEGGLDLLNIEIALPRELTGEQGISLVRDYVNRHFVAAGMCADVCLHDTGGNPHAHIMLTMRPFDEGGGWGAKQKKEYIPDRDGNKIHDPKKRQYKCKSIPTTDWNEQTKKGKRQSCR